MLKRPLQQPTRDALLKTEVQKETIETSLKVPSAYLFKCEFSQAIHVLLLLHRSAMAFCVFLWHAHILIHMPVIAEDASLLGLAHYKALYDIKKKGALGDKTFFF